MNAKTEHEFLLILRKTCRTMRQSRTRPEMAIPAAEWEIKINTRLDELEMMDTALLPFEANGKAVVA